MKIVDNSFRLASKKIPETTRIEGEGDVSHQLEKSLTKHEKHRNCGRINILFELNTIGDWLCERRLNEFESYRNKERGAYTHTLVDLVNWPQEKIRMTRELADGSLLQCLFAKIEGKKRQ